MYSLLYFKSSMSSAKRAMQVTLLVNLMSDAEVLHQILLQVRNLPQQRFSCCCCFFAGESIEYLTKQVT